MTPPGPHSLCCPWITHALSSPREQASIRTSFPHFTDNIRKEPIVAVFKKGLACVVRQQIPSYVLESLCVYNQNLKVQHLEA